MALTGTVDVPGLGATPKRYLAVGLGGTGLVVGWYWIRARRSAAAAAPAEDPSAAAGDTAAGGDPYAGAAGTAGAVDAYSNPAPGSVTTVAAPDPSTLPPATNPAWTQRAVDALSSVGYDPHDIADALGRYLNRTAPASQTEVTIIRNALAMVGPPPSGVYSLLPVPPATATSPTTPAKPSSPTAPAAPKGMPLHVVIVVPYVKAHPAWNSTIPGIAAHYHRTPNSVWNDTHNAALRAKRKTPSAIRPGDKVYVPV